jgi:hypothetical protein
LKVDVIVASPAPPAVAAKTVTTSVPIVFVGVAGPAPAAEPERWADQESALSR